MSIPDRTIAIVLAAGPSPPSLVSIFGNTSPAMIPVSGRPCIHWTLSRFAELGIRSVILGIRPGEARLRHFVTQAFAGQLEIHFVEPTEDRGPGFTLLQCLQHTPDANSALVVLGDTIFSLPENSATLFNSSFTLVNDVEDTARWCLAEVSDGVVLSLADKPKSNPADWPALIGVYFLRELDLVRRALESAAGEGLQSIQLGHALMPLIADRKLKGYAPGQWIDCGNIDFLTSARRRLLKVRSFNSMRVDELRGTVSKRSEHRAKFVNEINYYTLLPRDVAVFFPRVTDFSIRHEDTFLELEYYGYPTLSELWVFDEFDAQFWRSIFKRLAEVLACFAEYPLNLPQRSVFGFYWTKTVDRLADFESQGGAHSDLARLENLEVNGRTCRGWPVLAEPTRKRLVELAGNATGRIIHGDLCFPNILYDPISKLFKFIDPRGGFAEAGIFGDARYDAAKLLHSIHGGYDFLIHDMFSAKRDGASLEINRYFPANRDAVLAAFEETFSPAFPMRDVRLIEALLYLSMCPLHSDSPDRQLAMFGIGIELLNQAIHENLY